MDINIEVDQTRAQDQLDLETNSLQLQFVCNKVFNSIIKSTNMIPRDFLPIFQTVKDEIELNFIDQPETVHFAVGGLFFLRFVIPSIFAPHIYGLLPEPPSEICQRQTVLVAKILQNIANLVIPTKKEEFMVYVEGFIKTSIPKVRDFYLQLTRNQNIGRICEYMEVPERIKVSALANMYNFIYQNKDTIKENLGDVSEMPDFYRLQIDNLIETYGEPTLKARRKKSSKSEKQRKNSRKKEYPRYNEQK